MCVRQIVCLNPALWDITPQNAICTTYGLEQPLVQCGKEEGIFGGRKDLLTRQTEAMFMRKRKLQSYMPTNWHKVSKLHTWSEIGIMFKTS